MSTKLPNKEFQRLVPLLREKGFYEPEPQREICWWAYTDAQINDAKNVLSFIRDTVDSTNYLINKPKQGRPLTDPKILAKAILLSEFLGVPERPSQGWTSLLGPAIGIYHELDDRVIGDAYNHPEVLFILKQVFNNTVNSDGKLAGDGTGMEGSRKQNYESSKKSKAYLTSIVDSREIVQAFDVGQEEKAAMRELIEKVKGLSLCLDAGFVDRKLVKKIQNLGMKPFVFPKKNNKLNGSIAWKFMYLELLADVMQWLTEYHQRSHCESFHSSFKRRNPLVRKRRDNAQLCQITARIIIHNCRKLEYYSRIQ